MSQSDQNRRAIRCGRQILALITCVVIGCGRSTTETAPVVEPPAPAQDDVPSDDRQQDHPGSLELPPGDIPPPAATESRPADSGIKMPTDDPVDQSSSSTRYEIRYADWQQIQANAKTTGKVTVVDLWSLSCAPCLKEFPHLVELHQELGGQVACISVNMDYDGRKSRPPQHYAQRVEGFLESVGAGGFPTYISQPPSDDIFTGLDLASLPAVLVYDAEGTLAEMFVDAGEGTGVSYQADIKPLVAKLAEK